jgi:hypothetical protein
MKKFIISIAIIASAYLPAMAHPDGHDIEADDMVIKTIPEMAQDAVMTLITKATLDPSWAKVAPEKPEADTMGGSRIWVVSFRNDAEKDPTKRKLYVRLTDQGGFLSSTHAKP